MATKLFGQNHRKPSPLPSAFPLRRARRRQDLSEVTNDLLIDKAKSNIALSIFDYQKEIERIAKDCMLTKPHFPWRPLVSDFLKQQAAKLVNKKNENLVDDIVRPIKSIQPVPKIASVGAEIVTDHKVKNQELHGTYVDSICNYIKSLETLNPIKADFMLIQLEITPRMRAILIDWLVQVHSRLSLTIETLFLTVNILDRCLQSGTILRENLQLIGIAALFIAGKYEETIFPNVFDLIRLTDNAYSKQDLLGMEMHILEVLRFWVGFPLPIHFLRRYSLVTCCDVEVHNLAKYALELSLLEHEMSSVSPSLIAASALWLSLKLLRNDKWTDQLIFYSTYQESQLSPVVKKLCRILINANSDRLRSVRVKYASSRLGKSLCIS